MLCGFINIVHSFWIKADPGLGEPKGSSEGGVVLIQWTKLATTNARCCSETLFVQWPSLFGTDGVCCVQELLQQFVDAGGLFHSSRNPSSQVHDAYLFLGPINLHFSVKRQKFVAVSIKQMCHLSYVKAFCQNRQENEFSWKAIWVSRDWGLRSSELACFYLCQLIRRVQELQRLPYLPDC